MLLTCPSFLLFNRLARYESKFDYFGQASMSEAMMLQTCTTIAVKVEAVFSTGNPLWSEVSPFHWTPQPTLNPPYWNPVLLTIIVALIREDL